MFAYCLNNPVNYIDSEGFVPIDPSGDIGGWFGEKLAQLFLETLDDEVKKIAHEKGNAIMNSIEATAGFGLGHYIEVSVWDNALSFTIGCKYDVVSVKYDSGAWNTGQGFYSGMEASLVGLFEAGDSLELYRDDQTRSWEEISSDGYFEILSGGVYFFGGAAFSFGINTNSLKEIFSLY